MSSYSVWVNHPTDFTACGYLSPDGTFGADALAQCFPTLAEAQTVATSKGFLWDMAVRPGIFTAFAVHAPFTKVGS